jgi:hypothetical protein
MPDIIIFIFAIDIDYCRWLLFRHYCLFGFEPHYYFHYIFADFDIDAINITPLLIQISPCHAYFILSLPFLPLIDYAIID